MSLIDLYKARITERAADRLRTKAREVVRCYRHSWDVFGELLQNAVDAINRRHRILNEPGSYLYDETRKTYQITPDPSYRGVIRVTLDLAARSLQVEDNGVGIDRANMDRFLLPEETDKRLGRE